MPTTTTNHGTVKSWLLSLMGLTVRPDPPPPAPQADPPPHESDNLIDRIDVTVDAYCPCGSTHLHHLSLVSTSECARCSRTLAIRGIVYIRPRFGEMPSARVSVGYVFTPDSLRRRRTTGVH
jgi:hypothetical protein